MPRSEVSFALKLVERYAADKVPPHVRDKIRLEVDCEGNAITILECRPPWREGIGEEWTRRPIVRFRFNPSKRQWTLYWMRADMKFHHYDLIPPEEGIGPLIGEVSKDPHACFWG